MKKILVTGANGQLGKCIQDKAAAFPGFEFFFASRQALDLEDELVVEKFFKENNFDFCINAAAYIDVEKAESEPDKVFSINAEAVKTLAIQCKKTNTVLLHISTDYVFDGKKNKPYSEEDPTNPINVYGASKLLAEKYVQEFCPRHFIFRTSWLYSFYGRNFLKTVLNHAEAGKPLTITTEQTGSPTNAADVAEMLLEVIKNGGDTYGIYHYCNAGEATWYDFAAAILKHSNMAGKTKLAKTDHYRTFAARPKYSVLDTEKIRNTLNIKVKGWEESLLKSVSKEI